MAQNQKDPAKKLEGYDPSQRAEILETESVNVQGNDLIREITPDRGQSVTDPVPPEEQLNRDGKRIEAGTETIGDAAAESPDGGPKEQAVDEKVEKGDIETGVDGGGGISVLGTSEEKLEQS